MVKKKELFLFILLALLGIFILYIYYYIKQTQEDIFQKIQTNKIENVSYALQNIETSIIKQHSPENAQDLVSVFSIKPLRKECEEKISLLITPGIKYIYLLFKDKKGKFRFLLDASKTDKAHFYQKFDVSNKKYEEIYKTNKPQIIRQNDVENLYITYLYPIIKNNRVIAVLSVDITTKIQQNILNLIKPIETFFVVLMVFIFLLLIMTIFQLFHYIFTRKKIFTDSLTNLYNRNYLKEISLSLKLENYSIAMLDLDRFKSINDTYGHKAGDYILSHCSIIIKNSIRKDDILIRYGGEEFLLFVYKDQQKSALKVYERVRKNIDKHIFNYDANEISIHVSIGVHTNPEQEKNIQEAIKVADKLLYIAKKEGRNRVVYYDESSKNDIGIKTRDIDFVKLALNENRVFCYYQPIYNPKNNTILKYEALVRIIDINGDIISPIFFLPQLKHTNIHYKLTQKILSIVFDKFTNSDQSVSININFSDLINEDIANSIKKACKDKNLASRLTFEILESDEIENIKLFKEKINMLHSLGIKVSIDDFGSGYSNFRAVLDIEANFLKIDGSLVKNIDTNEKDFKVVHSIINFAKEANMKTIAEFVHSEDVYNKLIELDVDYMQGFYIAKPKDVLVQSKDLFQ